MSQVPHFHKLQKDVPRRFDGTVQSLSSFILQKNGPDNNHVKEGCPRPCLKGNTVKVREYLVTNELENDYT